MDKRDSFHLNNFDLLRLLAAMQVVVFHTSTRFDLSLGPFEQLVNAFPGVPIFFVISGFLISASFERSKSLYRYGKNRALRIFPALWACIWLTAAVAIGLGFDLLNLKGLVWLLAQMFGLIYTPGVLAEFGFGSYNGALWTIPVELQFYIILPIVYWLIPNDFKRTKYLGLVTLIFLVVALVHQHYLSGLDASLGEPKEVKLFRYTFVPHFFLFMVGVCLQRLKAEQMAVIRGKGLYWLAVYLVAAFLLPDNFVVHVFKLGFLAVVAISLAYTLPGIPGRFLKGNDISYGIYIYHGLVHGIFFELAFNDTWASGAAAIVVTILVAIVSWLVIERPFIRRKTSALKPEPVPVGT